MRLYFFLLLIPYAIFSQNNFEKYFEDKVLRFDYFHTGNKTIEKIIFDELKEEPYYSGSLTSLVDTFFYGNHFFKVFDKESGELIYSRGFSSLFQEWQSTEEAKTLERAFYETIILPYPKNLIELKIYSRDKDNNNSFYEIYSIEIDPANYFIAPTDSKKHETKEINAAGSANECLDILFIPDGYTLHEMENFVSKVEELSNYLFKFSPFDKYKTKINIRALLAPSEQSGTDIPANDIWKNTLLNSSFYTFDSERYLMTTDIKAVRDAASSTYYDQIVILVNTAKYGGGAIYNYYSMTCANNKATPKVFIHEFGHGFAGLADEYGNDPTYIDYYSSEYEPWEANITTLADFDSKWKNLVDPDTPIPTPSSDIYKEKLGAFEGAGYVDKGVYRPTYDSVMRSLRSDKFNEPSVIAIEKLIKFYSE